MPATDPASAEMMVARTAIEVTRTIGLETEGYIVEIVVDPCIVDPEPIEGEVPFLPGGYLQYLLVGTPVN